LVYLEFTKFIALMIADVDQCASGPCKGHNSVCSDLIGGYRCDCPIGYNGDGDNYCYGIA